MSEIESFSSDNRGPQILKVCIPCVTIAVALVATRLWVKLTLVKNVWFDDHLMVVAAPVMLAELVLIILQVQLGAGKHVAVIDPDDNIKGLYFNFMTQPLCLFAIALVKSSVGLLLLRLTTSKNLKRIIWATIIVTILAFMGNFLTLMLQCQPLKKIWNASVEGSCIPASNLKFALFFSAGVNVITDIIFATLPAIILWRVQLNRRTKLATVPILSLGFFAAIACIVRMFFLENYGKTGDFLYDSADMTIWTTVEITVGMIAACVPALKPLFRALLKDATSLGVSRNSIKNPTNVQSRDLETGSQSSGRPFVNPHGITKTTKIEINNQPGQYDESKVPWYSGQKNSL